MTRKELLEKLVEQGKMNRGTINGFHGSWMSGIATLIIDGRPVPCENTTTARTLDAAFGDVIISGHTVDSNAIAGKEIYWSMDEMGLVLGGFTPVDAPEMEDEVDETEYAEALKE